MPIDLETLRQLHHILRPHATRVVNMIARATIPLIDDTTKMQLVQLAGLLGGPYPGAEHFQPYGFSSVPLPPNADGAAEAIAFFPNGDREHPVVLTIADRRYAPTGRDPGDVTMHHFTGAKITMTQDGDIIATPASGRHVLVEDGAGGTPHPLVNVTDFNNHTHPAPGGATSPPTDPLTGTTTFKAQ
jgi:phage baseplate assembly protein V